MANTVKITALRQHAIPDMPDILGQALLEYHKGSYSGDIRTYSSLGEESVLPLPYLFRDYAGMPHLEQVALANCTGKILDIGCGAGSHALYLQNRGLNVTGIDASAGAIETCIGRGLKKTLHGDICHFSGMKFDTLLLLMNGIGIAGRLGHLESFLDHLGSMLNPGGQILLDSSNIIYMFEEDGKGHYLLPDTESYYGEVEFTMEYNGKSGTRFPWLYLDEKTLEAAAKRTNFAFEIILKGAHFDYLAKLTPLDK